MHLGPPPSEEHVPLLGALDALEFLVVLVGLILTSLEFQPLMVIHVLDFSRGGVDGHLEGLDSKGLKLVEAFRSGTCANQKKQEIE